MYQRPQEPALTPPAELLGATVQLYLRWFRPLFFTAAGVACIPALLSLIVRPEELAMVYLWMMLLLALETAAQSAVLWAAATLRRGHSVNPASIVMAAIAFGPRYFAGAFLLLSAAVLPMLSPLTILFLPASIYVIVRASLYGPAIVLENASIIDSLMRSWRLVQDRWWRTFALELMMFSTLLMASLVAPLLALGGAGTPVLFAASVVLSGLVVPLLMCFFLLLFEDYRRVSDRSNVAGPTPPSDRPY